MAGFSTSFYRSISLSKIRKLPWLKNPRGPRKASISPPQLQKPLPVLSKMTGRCGKMLVNLLLGTFGHMQEKRDDI